MADDDSNNAGEASTSSSPSSSSSPTTPQQLDDRSQILAQATRFLTSANISESASDDDKREFLRSKGLTEDEITRVFQDAKSPVEGLSAHRSQPASGDLDPFELAARQFDDPINADALAPPPKSYPNSPLALYYDPPASHPATTTQSTHSAHQGTPASPLTRYQVLLQFFRTLSYMMMLSGGLTAILVTAYRAYVLPKFTAMFDARSIVLKHHIVLFDRLRSNVASLATYVPVQHARLVGLDDSAAAATSAGGVASPPLKGVLKKVHFHDEVDAAKDSDKEGVKSTQHGSGMAGSEKVVMPGTDVVVDAKTPLLSEAEGSETDASTVSEGAEAEQVVPKLEPIDLMTPIRESMARLASALKTDLSGRPTTPATPSTTSPRGARVASVVDAGSGSDEWEDDSASDANTSDQDDDDDGLEFDPYGAYQKKHKHTQSSSSPHTTTNAASGSGSASLADLRSTLVSLNADISAHAFAASASAAAGAPGGAAFRFGPAAAGAGSGAESPKSGDLGQVKAEIRSLKGLLLSRRNFPSYGARPPPLPAAVAAGVEARAGSAVV
ncbi:hypothetical protein EX895_000990 [Sporisorium graminicola]|uniref:Peroxisomal membrane protein PEX14 n=1 Tax=Sporisorium graminicola TaxID=280036 RepID=A0A4U7L158_9BASI|nr:hypothetical protein EX895_000990 [Sporisorium graminicola]TKY90991.1 hypothetical protein EX895_000990 [Sporisorium graminicola]